MVHYALTHVF